MVMTALLSSSCLEAQILTDDIFRNPQRTVSRIPKGCNDIEVDEEGNLYLLQSSRNAFTKIFASTGYDSSLTIGGKGLGREGFNYPSRAIVQNRQAIYILDQLNRRVVLLNTNLKVSREISFLDLGEGPGTGEDEEIYPVSFAAATSGELFLLNQNNYRIYKLNIYGKLETVFGGLDYGFGSLSDPVEITGDQNNNFYVSDTSKQTVTVFDLYGIYQFSLPPECSFRWKRIMTFGNYLVCFQDRKVFFRNMLTRKITEAEIPEGEKLIDIAASRDHLCLLLENKVNLYPLR